MLLCYITDRRQFPGNDSEQRRQLLEKIAEAAESGVDFIQLREKDLSTRELERLAREAQARIAEVPVGRSPTAGARSQPLPPPSRFLINSRADVAIAVGADGVHLPADDISASEASVVFSKVNIAHPVIGVSCHSADEVALAESHGADFAVFGPVFEKSGRPGIGLEALRAACRRALIPGKAEATREPIAMPVLALGGVNLENARACAMAGAAGIAAIRLFQENRISDVVHALRGA